MQKPLDEIINYAKETIRIESEAIINLPNLLTDDFAKCVNRILICPGRVVITGIGKSAIIASKIVATLNSTGTPAHFMHAADAIHGDLGILQKEDIAICISNSGSSPEISVLIPMLKAQSNCLVAMVGNLNSHLARQADLILNTTVEREASPGNPLPTASTTAQLVMGDALAMALLQCRGFTAGDFARYHPGGALGKQLYLKVDDLYKLNEKPKVDKTANIREVILEISSKRLGATAVIDDSCLSGIITDGDLRRMLQSEKQVENLTAQDIMTKNPKTVPCNTLAIDALQLMRDNNITQLPVVQNAEYIGMIHLHDILKEGII
jgi:arabinose-5-phosphate isomerase